MFFDPTHLLEFKRRREMVRLSKRQLYRRSEWNRNAQCTLWSLDGRGMLMRAGRRVADAKVRPLAHGRGLIEDALPRYESSSIEQLARYYRISTSPLWQLLAEHGVTRRRQGRPSADATNIVIFSGLEAGHSQAEIARELGISKQAVNQRIQRAKELAVG